MATLEPASGAEGDRAFFGHPRGLKTLFFTEMWERFSYYGMRAFLILYLVAPVKLGGMGMADATGGIILGCYTASVYLMSVPGGWIADRFLGLRRAVLIGGILIMSGHVVLAIPIADALYLGLGLIVFGTGLLKPNISAVVGQLYAANDKRRDAGYSIYYMGINLGAFIAPIFTSWLATDDGFRAFLKNTVGIDPNSAWHIAFALAAIGMFCGLVQYVRGVRHLGDAGAHPTPPKNEAEAKHNRLILIGIGAAIVGFIGLLVGLVNAGVLADKEAVGTMCGYLLSILTIGLFGALYIKGCRNTDERRRLTLILVLFFGATIFWGCFEQASGVLTIFSQELTDRRFLGFEIPAGWFQSINAMFIIIFAPVFAALWLALAKRNAEPTSPAKFGTALVLVGLGFGVMIPAAMKIDGDPTGITSWIASPGHLPLVSPWFLITLYLFHTFAELCLSPVGLSSMSKLAPARWGGLVMGIWFLGAANGNFLAGKAVKYSSTMASSPFFTAMLAFPVAVAAVFFILVKPIARMLAKSSAPAHE